MLMVMPLRAARAKMSDALVKLMDESCGADDVEGCIKVTKVASKLNEAISDLDGLVKEAHEQKAQAQRKSNK